jgi:hypothetical protein
MFRRGLTAGNDCSEYVFITALGPSAQNGSYKGNEALATLFASSNILVMRFEKNNKQVFMCKYNGGLTAGSRTK